MPKLRKGQHGNVERRGKSYRIQLCVAGTVHRFSVRTTDLRVAQAAARQRHAELEHAHNRRLEGLPDVVRMSVLLDEFEAQLASRVAGTRRAYGDSIKPIRKYFVDIAGNLPVDKVRAAHIDAYVDWRRTHRLAGRRKTDGGPLSARSLNKDRSILHRLFAIAERREYCPSNPVKRTERQKGDAHEAVILTQEEYRRLLTASAENPTLALFALALGETGMRCESEALHLRWQDVSFETGFITVVSGREGHRTKSGKSRLVPMTPELTSALKAHYAAYRFASQSQYVFHHTSTKRHHTNGGRIFSLRCAFKNAAKRAKLSTRFRQHDLRHRRVTTWLAEGKSPVLVMQAMGHSRLETTMMYYKYLPEHLRGLVDASPSTASALRAM